MVPRPLGALEGLWTLPLPVPLLLRGHEVGSVLGHSSPTPKSTECPDHGRDLWNREPETAFLLTGFCPSTCGSDAGCPAQALSLSAERPCLSATSLRGLSWSAAAGGPCSFLGPCPGAAASAAALLT